MRGVLGIVPVAVILMLTVSRGAGPRQPGDTEREQAGPPTWAGLYVTLPRDDFAAGEPIPLTCEFRNRSKSPVTVWQRGFFPNHLVVVGDEAGVEPPLTEAGRLRRASFAPRGPWHKNIPVTIRPGGSLPLAGGGASKVDLAEMYQLTPGRYSVVVAYEDWQQPAMTQSSDPIKFEVKPRQ